MKMCWKIVREHRWAKEQGCWDVSTCCPRSQNRITELSDFDQATFLLAHCLRQGSAHLPSKQAPEHQLVEWSNRLHWYPMVVVDMNICACVHMYRSTQMTPTNVHQPDWQRPCFSERHVYGSRLMRLLSEPTPLFINWLASPAGPQ